MAHPQLIAYIKEHRGQFSKDQLVQALAGAGWSAPDIAEAFQEIDRPAPAPVPTPTPVSTPTPAPVPTPSVVPAPAPGTAQVMPPPIEVLAQKAEPAPTTTPTPAPVVAPIQKIEPKPVQPATGSNFLEEMEKHRKEAATAQPLQSTGVGAGAVQFSPAPTTSEKGIVGMLIRWKLAKDASQANMIMIGVIVVAVGISLWLIL